MKESYITEIMNKKAELSGENNEEIRSCLDTLVTNLEKGEDSTEEIRELLIEAREEIRRQKAHKMPQVAFFGDNNPRLTFPEGFRSAVEPYKNVLQFLDKLIGKCTIELHEKEKENYAPSSVCQNEKKDNYRGTTIKVSSLDQKLDRKMATSSGIFEFDFDVEELEAAVLAEQQRTKIGKGPY